MAAGEQTVTRVLELLQGVEAPIDCATVAERVGRSNSVAWDALETLRAQGRIRIGDYRTDKPGVRAPMYDTRIDLPPAERPPRMSREESGALFRERLKADPERKARHDRQTAASRKRKTEERRTSRKWAVDLVREALQKSSGPLSVPWIVYRSGISRRTVQRALETLIAATPKAARIADWKRADHGGPLHAVYDTRVELPDAPYPGDKNDTKIIRRSVAQDVPVHAAVAR